MIEEPAPRIAVIGCGNWGVNHVRNWYSLGCLEVVCDQDPERLIEIRQQYPDLEFETEYQNVLEREEIDGVVLVTPAASHAEHTKLALKHSKHVLVEKPLALTVDEGERLVKLAERKSQVLMVGHVMEYHPAIQRLSDLLEMGELGRLRYIYSNRLNWGRIRTEENALWNFAPHDVGIMLRLVEGMPRRIQCDGGAYLNHDVADVTLTMLEFQNEVRGHVFVSWLHPFKEQRFVVVGSDQIAVFDDTLPWEEKLTLYPHRVNWVNGQMPKAVKADGVPVELSPAEPLKKECLHFVKNIHSSGTPLTDGRSGVRVLKVLSRAQEALELSNSSSSQVLRESKN